MVRRRGIFLVRVQRKLVDQSLGPWDQPRGKIDHGILLLVPSIVFLLVVQILGVARSWMAFCARFPQAVFALLFYA